MSQRGGGDVEHKVLFSPEEEQALTTQDAGLWTHASPANYKPRAGGSAGPANYKPRLGGGGVIVTAAGLGRRH